MTKLLKKDT
jgi:hypothetical protein